MSPRKRASTTTPTSRRVDGTWLDVDGVRHEATGMSTNDSARPWETRTTCGKRTVVRPTDRDLVVTCLFCWGKRHPTDILRTAGGPGILRGLSADVVYIDEAQDFNLSSNPCGEIWLDPTTTPEGKT